MQTYTQAYVCKLHTSTHTHKHTHNCTQIPKHFHARIHRRSNEQIRIKKEARVWLERHISDLGSSSGSLSAVRLLEKGIDPMVRKIYHIYRYVRYH
jgi:hypothetical protein